MRFLYFFTFTIQIKVINIKRLSNFEELRFQNLKRLDIEERSIMLRTYSSNVKSNYMLDGQLIYLSGIYVSILKNSMKYIE